MSSPGLEKFLRDWCVPDFGPHPVQASQFAEVERKLSVSLPDGYKSAICEYGCPRPTIALLEFICDNQLDLPDVSDFHSPDEIVAVTRDWREIGMPEQLVAFANDCSGNQFAFSFANGSDPEAIWFWDHDFDNAELIADSFESWIAAYGALKN